MKNVFAYVGDPKYEKLVFLDFYVSSKCLRLLQLLADACYRQVQAGVGHIRLKVNRYHLPYYPWALCSMSE
jgi:hypothetical protein